MPFHFCKSTWIEGVCQMRKHTVSLIFLNLIYSFVSHLALLGDVSLACTVQYKSGD